MNTKLIVFLVITFFSVSLFAANKNADCVSCTKTTVGSEVQPDKKAIDELGHNLSAPLILSENKGISRSPAVVPDQILQKDYQVKFCLQFSNIQWQVITKMLDEMQASPYPIDDYFKTSVCQSEGYSNVVKSPLAHIIADDPGKRVKFLDIMWLYYNKKRNDPLKFVEMVNAKNTEGETLLDYLESMRIKGKYTKDSSKNSVAKIISEACSHGAIYSAYPDKKCP